MNNFGKKVIHLFYVGTLLSFPVPFVLYAVGFPRLWCNFMRIIGVVMVVIAAVQSKHIKPKLIEKNKLKKTYFGFIVCIHLGLFLSLAITLIIMKLLPLSGKIIYALSIISLYFWALWFVRKEYYKNLKIQEELSKEDKR